VRDTRCVLDFELPRPQELSDEHWNAVVDGLDRITRARNVQDWPAAVGAAKELCETVARVILAGHHADLSGDFPMLISSAHKVLARHPGQASDAPLRNMASAASKLVRPLAELRNNFGTGHGRAVVPPTEVEHAMLASDAAFTWIRWALWRLDAVLASSVDRIIADLDSGALFTRGALARRLADAHLAALDDEDLMRLGRAIAHRGAHGGTFVVEEDGIHAVVAEPLKYPAALRRGLLAGLFVDANGYVRARPEDLPKAKTLADSLDDTTFFHEFSAAVAGKDFSYAMNTVAAVQIAALIGAIAQSAKSGTLREAWDRLRVKFSSAAE
jgi:hypothetical protein